MILLADRELRRRRSWPRRSRRPGPISWSASTTDRRAAGPAPLPDGSWLSRFGGVPVRVVDAEITIATSAGRATGRYRLITTLLDPHRYPAGELVSLYHQRWEIETAYLELKSTILGGRVLRARTPDGVDQEIYALLVAYQALRTAMADATATEPGPDPDRASFTIALNTARDQIIQAAGIIAGTAIDLAGTIGRRVLADLMPATAATRQPPRRQTRDLQVQRPRPTSTGPPTKPPSPSTSSPPP